MSRHDSPADSYSGHEPAPSDDGSWHYMDIPSDASSVAFQRSPASGSLASYGVVVHRSHGYRGASLSPALNCSPETHSLQLPPTSSPAQMTGEQRDTSFSTSSHPSHLANSLSLSFASQGNQRSDVSMASSYSSSHYPTSSPETSSAALQQLLMGMDNTLNGMSGFYSEGIARPSHFQSAFPTSTPRLQQQQQQQSQHGNQQNHFDIPSHLQSSDNAPAWDPTSVSTRQQSQLFAVDSFGLASLSPASSYASVSASASISQSASPRSPAISRFDAEQQPPELQLTPLQQLQLEQLQQEIMQFQQTQQDQQTPPLQFQQQQVDQTGQLQQEHFSLDLATETSDLPLMDVIATGTSVSEEPKLSPPKPTSKSIPSRPAPSSINKVRGSSTRITKKKAPGSSSTLQLSGSYSSSSSDDKFVIFTPKTISTHVSSGNRFNAFECFEAMSATQKGRKGPLAEEVKESALQVRRAGACFCCHSRKVKCDAQLPCKNCIKLVTHLPQAICWRFDDFISPLFPYFMRQHFSKAEMAEFVSNNVASFTDSGPFTVYLSSGSQFKAALEIRNVRIFNPTPGAIAMQHARMTTNNGQLQVSSENSIPLCLDLSENSVASTPLQSEKIKKALRAYVEAILKEDAYVETVTANLKQSTIPKKILTMVRAFYLKTNSPIVKQAFYVYTLQYMMMYHLSLTPQTLQTLSLAGHLLSDTPFQTARLLGRQIKAILDEMMRKDVDKLFSMFSRELKPKARTAWATCLAAFLVFCLFLEATGLSFDNFVVTENETKLQNHEPLNPRTKRAVAVKMNRALENLPFRQFAFQFHNIYQTHQTATTSGTGVQTSNAPSPSTSSGSGSSSSSPNTSSSSKAAFNPLVDDGPLLSGDLDKHANEFVRRLRTLLVGENWTELDFLCYNDIFGCTEDYPLPRDISMDYTGRLCSKFLLSFQHQSYLSAPA